MIITKTGYDFQQQRRERHRRGARRRRGSTGFSGSTTATIGRYGDVSIGGDGRRTPATHPAHFHDSDLPFVGREFPQDWHQPITMVQQFAATADTEVSVETRRQLWPAAGLGNQVDQHVEDDDLGVDRLDLMDASSVDAVFSELEQWTS